MNVNRKDGDDDDDDVDDGISCNDNRKVVIQRLRAVLLDNDGNYQKNVSDVED